MYSTYVFFCCLIFIRTRDITTPKRNFSGEAVEALAHQSGLSVVNHSPLRGWHHDASNLKWTANKSRELIWFFQVRPYPTSVITQSAWTKLDTHTHTLLQRSGTWIDLQHRHGCGSKWMAPGGLSQKIPKTNPKSWSLRQQCNTLNLPGSSPCYRVHTTWRTRLSTEHYRAVSRYIPLGCGRGGSCLGDIAALLQKGTSSLNIDYI